MPAISSQASAAPQRGSIEPTLSASKLKILAVAEKAFAEHGIDGVSLRQISERSGSRNVMAAQYHFKTKDNLVAEIIGINNRALDRLRQRLYVQADTDLDQMSTQQYVRLVIQPFVELKNDDGERTFVRFLRSLLHHDPYYSLWKEHYARAPLTDAIYLGLRRSLPPLPDPIWEIRKTIVGKLVVNSLCDHSAQTHLAISESLFMADLIQIVTAVLRAPAGMAEHGG